VAVAVSATAEIHGDAESFGEKDGIRTDTLTLLLAAVWSAV